MIASESHCMETLSGTADVNANNDDFNPVKQHKLSIPWSHFYQLFLYRQRAFWYCTGKWDKRDRWGCLTCPLPRNCKAIMISQNGPITITWLCCRCVNSWPHNKEGMSLRLLINSGQIIISIRPLPLQQQNLSMLMFDESFVWRPLSIGIRYNWIRVAIRRKWLIMTNTEILEWVMGWPWPVIIVFVLLIAGGIMRLLSEDAQGLSEHQSSGPIPGKECSCRCE